MIPLYEVAFKLVTDLNEVAPVALVGGLAVSARAGSRFTKDVDLAVAAATDRDAERVIYALQSRGYQTSVILENTRLDRLATVRMTEPGTRAAGLLLDLIFASCGIEAEVVANAEPIEIIAGLTLPVARTGHLIAMKLVSHHPTRRPQDASDLLALIEVADKAELERCREAIVLIRSRGFAKEKNLDADLTHFLTEHEFAKALPDGFSRRSR